MTFARPLLKTFLGMMDSIGRMRMGLPARGVLIVPLIFGVGMRVVFLGMTFCFALKLWEGDMSGISSAFRKAKRTAALRLSVRMGFCLCGVKGPRGARRPSASTSVSASSLVKLGLGKICCA